MNPEERKLIEKAIKGDQQAWREICVRYGEPIIKKLYSLTINSLLDPEDIFQEACIRAFLAFQKDQFVFGRSKSFYSWLYKVALNFLIDEFGKTRSRVHIFMDSDSANDVVDGLSSEDWNVLEKLELAERITIVQEAVQSLFDPYREIVELFYFHDLTGADIAELLGLTEGNVRIILHRARKRLRENLEANEAVKSYLDWSEGSQ